MIANIVTVSGCDFIRGFLYATAIGGAPIDITGCTLQMMVRSTVEDLTIYVSLTSGVGGGIVIANPTGGAFTITITKDQLSRLAEGNYVHSLTITWPDSHTDEIWHGALTHSFGATR